jgi:anti-sigma regulatory factor (Ser/Thr protein kinase)
MVLENSLDAIEDGRLRLLQHFEGAGLSDRAVHRLELIFEEVVANIVRHGFSAGADHAILAIAEDQGDAVELVLEDDAPPFNPLLLEPAAPAGSLSEARIGGLGVPLLRKFSLSLDYEAVPAGRREPFARADRGGNRLRVRIAKI